MSTNVHYRTCCLCEAMCGIEIKTEDKKIISIKGDEKDPLSRGYICPKAVALQDLHNDPNRLKHPVKRTEDGWKRISWDEAFDEVANKLFAVQKEHGNNAVASYLGNPNVHSYSTILYTPPFLHSLKTKNKFSATSVDQLPHHLVSQQLFGHQLLINIPDIDNTDYLLILGGNPLASNGSLMSVPDIKNRLKSVRNRGKVVVVDPRRSETADVASEHYFIKPSTDVLLLLAMINTILTEGLTRSNHTTELIDNLDQLPDLFAEYTAERVASKTGIESEAIKNIAREFAAAERAVVYGRMGVSVQTFGALCHWLIAVLNIITGRLDTKGGAMFPKPAADILTQSSPGRFARNKSRVRGLPDFGGEFPVSVLAEEMLTPGEGQVKALLTSAGNPVISTPNGRQLEKGLEQLEFMVSIDIYINETTKHANIILPPVGHLERDHYDVIFNLFTVHNTAKYSEALFKAEEDTREDWQIMLELQKRLNSLRGNSSFKEKMGFTLNKTLKPTGMLNFLLQTGPYGNNFNPLKKGLSLKKLKQHPHGLDIGELKPCLPERLFTRNKRINITPEIYIKDMSRVESNFFKQEVDELPFLLIGRRHIRSNNSWMHNSHRLVKGKKRCTAMLHPDDALNLGISSNDPIKIESRTGAIEIEAEVTDEIMPGVVSVPHGWGHTRSGIKMDIAQNNAGVSTNDITDDQRIDQLSGNSALNGVPVKLVSLT